MTDLLPDPVATEIRRNYETARKAAEEIERAMQDTIRKIDAVLALSSPPPHAAQQERTH